MKTTVSTVAVVLLAPLAALHAAESNPPPTGALIYSELMSSVLAGPMRDVENIVFAVRGMGPDGHWYANFGYWVNDPNDMQ